MYQKYGAARGQRTVAGAPIQIADQMERWFLNRAVDGYLIQPPVLPKGWTNSSSWSYPSSRTEACSERNTKAGRCERTSDFAEPKSRYSREA